MTTGKSSERKAEHDRNSKILTQLMLIKRLVEKAKKKKKKS